MIDCSPRPQLRDQQPGLHCLSQSHVVGQQHSAPVASEHRTRRRELVRQDVDGRCVRRSQRQPAPPLRQYPAAQTTPAAAPADAPRGGWDGERFELVERRHQRPPLVEIDRSESAKRDELPLSRGGGRFHSPAFASRADPIACAYLHRASDSPHQPATRSRRFCDGESSHRCESATCSATCSGQVVLSNGRAAAQRTDRGGEGMGQPDYRRGRRGDVAGRADVRMALKNSRKVDSVCPRW